MKYVKDSFAFKQRTMNSVFLFLEFFHDFRTYLDARMKPLSLYGQMTDDFSRLFSCLDINSQSSLSLILWLDL